MAHFSVDAVRHSARDFRNSGGSIPMANTDFSNGCGMTANAFIVPPLVSGGTSRP
jgi:hypothetical protein